MPFVRVPDATESDIQKATDIGALGIIVPTVDTVEKSRGCGEVGQVSATGAKRNDQDRCEIESRKLGRAEPGFARDCFAGLLQTVLQGFGR
jgi:hypothetical protein